MKSIIQAAIESGRPPLELLLDQPNRERSRLDGILIKAYYLQKAYEVDGYPIWIEESTDVDFVAKGRVIRSLAVVEKAQEAEGKKKHTTHGKRFHAEVILHDGAKWPTRAAWIARRAAGHVVPEDGVSPERRAEAEERAKQKAAENPEVAAIVAEFAERFNKQPGRMD